MDKDKTVQDFVACVKSIVEVVNLQLRGKEIETLRSVAVRRVYEKTQQNRDCTERILVLL